MAGARDDDDAARRMQSWRDAVALWAQFSSGDDDTPHETAHRPMHPGVYYRLAAIAGFVDTNGRTYDEYVERWRVRYTMSGPPARNTGLQAQ